MMIKLGPVSIFSSVHSASSFLTGLSAALIIWRNSILYTCNLSFLWRTLCTGDLGIPNSKLHQRINFYGLRSKAHQILSTVSSLTAGLPGDSLLRTPPRFFELFEPVADVVHTEWFPSKFIPALTLLTNDFVSANHKTHCDFSLSLNIISSVQWCGQQQADSEV